MRGTASVARFRPVLVGSSSGPSCDSCQSKGRLGRRLGARSVGRPRTRGKEITVHPEDKHNPAAKEGKYWCLLQYNDVCSRNTRIGPFHPLRVSRWLMCSRLYNSLFSLRRLPSVIPNECEESGLPRSLRAPPDSSHSFGMTQVPGRLHAHPNPDPTFSPPSWKEQVQCFTGRLRTTCCRPGGKRRSALLESNPPRPTEG